MSRALTLPCGVIAGTRSAQVCAGLCVWSHCAMLGRRGGGNGELKDDKVQAPFDPQPTYYTEVLYSEGELSLMST